jgi:hypothetical protein
MLLISPLPQSVPLALALAENLRVTDNGQFLFSAVTRPKYVLDAMIQLVKICEKLAAAPLDPFLQVPTQGCVAACTCRCSVIMLFCAAVS